MVVVSSPAKIILFGEHAVVYGTPAIAMAIERRIFVKAETLSEKKLVVLTGRKKVSFPLHILTPEGEFRYVKKAVAISLENTGYSSGIKLEINSEIPRASGLGSSAAVSVAVLKAVHELYDVELSPEELAKLGHRVEREVQGAASPTDTATSALGGVLLIKPGAGIERIELNRDIPLVVGCTGIKRSTGKVVAGVRELRDRHPEIIDGVMECIGRLVLKAKCALESGDLKTLGELMDINQGLLEALGVSNLALARRIYSARKAGALGAKLTGAGAGGCMIALAPEHQEKVKKVLGKNSFITTTARAGTKVESLE